jgi:hypothetical protein
MTEQGELFDTLAQARHEVRAKWRDGMDCPCCGQLVKLYRRKIDGHGARFLIWLVRSWNAKPGWYNRLEAPTFGQAVSGGAYALPHYWDLMEQQPNETNPRLPASRSGIWRPTKRGLLFAKNLLTLPKYALVFNGQCYGFEGEDVSISDALPEWFDFWEAWGHD